MRLDRLAEDGNLRMKVGKRIGQVGFDLGDEWNVQLGQLAGKHEHILALQVAIDDGRHDLLIVEQFQGMGNAIGRAGHQAVQIFDSLRKVEREKGIVFDYQNQLLLEHGSPQTERERHRLSAASAPMSAGDSGSTNLK